MNERLESSLQLEDWSVDSCDALVRHIKVVIYCTFIVYGSQCFSILVWCCLLISDIKPNVSIVI